jgi:hypothetical protein
MEHRLHTTGQNFLLSKKGDPINDLLETYTASCGFHHWFSNRWKGDRFGFSFSL